jgi:hypothetical protein
MTTSYTLTAITYEKEHCGRCGGSGRYSYNQMDGDRCYGCGGSGQRLSKRGRAAKAMADELLNIAIQDFPSDGTRKARYTCTLAGKRVTFSAVEQDGTDKSKGINDTEWRITPRYAMLMRQKDGTFKKADTTLSASMGVRLIPTLDDIKAVMDYQSSLTKAGKPSKRKAKT